jgi:N-acetyltransferase 10
LLILNSPQLPPLDASAYQRVNYPRYAIDDASTDWAAAEAQIHAAGNQRGKSTVVSVKTSSAVGQKRKADAVAETPSAKTRKSRRSLARKQKR